MISLKALPYAIRSSEIPMAINLAKIHRRLRTCWDADWKIPQPDLYNVLFFFAISAMFLLWLCLSVLGVEARVANAALRRLPESFFFANLFLLPLLCALAAGPLPLGLLLRSVVFFLFLCSAALDIIPRQHQTAGLLMLGFLYLEAFWIIPRWNKWNARQESK
jgi:hypothetical protein